MKVEARFLGLDWCEEEVSRCSLCSHGVPFVPEGGSWALESAEQGDPGTSRHLCGIILPAALPGPDGQHLRGHHLPRPPGP